MAASLPRLGCSSAFELQWPKRNTNTHARNALLPHASSPSPLGPMPRSKDLSSSFFVPSLCCSYPHVPWGQMDYLLRERKAASSEEENRQLVDGKGVKQQRAIAHRREMRQDSWVCFLLWRIINTESCKAALVNDIRAFYVTPTWLHVSHLCVCLCVSLCMLSLLLPGSASVCLCLLYRVSFAKLCGSQTAPISKPGRKGCVSRYGIQDMPGGPHTQAHTHTHNGSTLFSLTHKHTSTH